MRPLMAHLESTYDAPFYRFVTVNVLLSADFKQSVREVAEWNCREGHADKLMLVGKCKNLLEVTPLTGAKEAPLEVYKMRKRAKTSLKEAIDYFVLSRALFDWSNDSSFPDYVVSRPHYNNARKPSSFFRS